MADAPNPPRLDRSTRNAKAAPAEPDPAELGTAYGMEMSMDTPAVNADPAQVDADEDSLGWIRRWLDRHAPR
jgi:hypothetical protein